MIYFAIICIVIIFYYLNKFIRGKKFISSDIYDNIVPHHIGIIMDGNGRWGKNHGGSRILGHKKGVDILKEIIKICREKYNIKYLTVFAFSDENWNRDEKEINFIFHLVEKLLTYYINNPDITKDIKFNIIGDFSKINNDIKNLIYEIMEKTKNNNKIVVTICLSYSGKNDIVNCCKNISKLVMENKLDINSIDKIIIKENLMTKDIPDIDLLIRTSGELRLSNFMLWDIAYSELYFDDTFWPDYSEKNLINAFDSYNKRNRRFGKN